MSALFRQQAIAHKYQRLHGPVLLAHSWSNAALVLFLAMLVAAIVAFACVFGFTRKEAVAGVVVPDKSLLRVTAPQTGTVSRVFVREGQSVREGDAMYVISSERTTAQGDTQASINGSVERQIGRLQDELAQQRRQAAARQRELTDQIGSLQASLRHLDVELTSQRKKVQLLRDLADRIGELAKDGSVSRNTATLRSADLLEQESRLASLEAQRLALMRDLSAARTRSDELPLQMEREASQLKRDILGKEQQASEGEARREIVVRARQAGRVAGLVARAGQPVVADQYLANIIPDGSIMEAELYMPTRAAGFVRPGTDVLLRYDAFPYQKYGQFKGKVREVALAAVPAGELRARSGERSNEAPSSEPMYWVRVQLERQAIPSAGEVMALKPGMQIAASLVLEHRTIAEWAFAPLLGITKQ